MNDNYVYVITALLPLSALMLVLQVNPYHALVIQGILGSVAALVFAVLGAADVALTQALMGTLLAITLYAIAVRSSLVMRLGVLQEDAPPEDAAKNNFEQLLHELRTILGKYYMRLELVYYTDAQALQQGLTAKQVHATCTKRSPLTNHDLDKPQLYHTVTRVKRLHEIMQAGISSSATILTYTNTPDLEEKH